MGVGSASKLSLELLGGSEGVVVTKAVDPATGKRTSLRCVPSAECLSHANIVLFYFSAEWCQRCSVFTPILKKFYEQAKACEQPTLEIVFCSSDVNADMFKTCFTGYHPDGEPFVSDYYKSYLSSIQSTGEALPEHGGHGDYIAIPFEAGHKLRQRVQLCGSGPEVDRPYSIPVLWTVGSDPHAQKEGSTGSESSDDGEPSDAVLKCQSGEELVCLTLPKRQRPAWLSADIQVMPQIAIRRVLNIMWMRSREGWQPPIQ